jgi:Family of unknown function (DUF5343)
MPEETQTDKPPYLPWTTFENITEELGAKGLPPQLDRSAIQGKSGGTQSQYLSALEFLGFVDGNKVPTDAFKSYVTDKTKRSEVMAAVLKDKYAGPLSLGKNATAKQLESKFREYGIAGDTQRKAIAFFVNAAKLANISLSPYFPKTRPKKPGGTKPASRTRKRTANRPKTEETVTPPGPPPPTTRDPKEQYVNLLLKKAEEDMTPELLDRIERVIGVAQAEGSQEEEKTSSPETEGGGEDW